MAAPPPHPFAAGEADLRAALAAWAAGSGLDTPPAPWFPALPLWLPSHAGRPELSYDAGPEAAPAPWAVGALALAPPAALALLLRPPAPADAPRLGGALRGWAAVARLAAALLAGGRYLPAWRSDEDGDWAVWEPVWTDPRDTAARAALAAALPRAALAATPEGDALSAIDSFVAAAVEAAVRAWGRPDALPAPPRSGAPARAAGRVRMAAGRARRLPADRRRPGAAARFTRQYHAWRDGQQPALGTPSFRVCFRLEPPAPPADLWLLHFLLQATDDPSLLLPAAHIWRLPGAGPAAAWARLPAPGRPAARGAGGRGASLPATAGDPAPSCANPRAAERPRRL